MFMSQHRPLTSYVLALAVTCTCDAQTQFQSVEGKAEASEIGTPHLSFGPIDGFTVASHSAPRRLPVPLGRSVPLSLEGVPQEARTLVRWECSATLLVDGVSAVCPIDDMAPIQISVAIDSQGLRQECELVPVVVEPADLTFEYSIDSSPPFFLPEDASNEGTVRAFRAGSIAAVSRIGRNQYVTSIHRGVELRVDPLRLPFSLVELSDEETAALIEWRADGASLGVGSLEHVFARLGEHRLEVGPPGAPKVCHLTAYRTSISFEEHDPNSEIVRYQDEGVPLLLEETPLVFTARTDPPGFEEHVRWLSATKFGTAEPTLGMGEHFSTMFSDTLGPDGYGGLWQWVGVRADDATLGQDQKVAVPILIEPHQGDVVTGVVPVSAEAADETDDLDVALMLFEYSSDGVVWQVAGGVGAPIDSLIGAPPNNFDTTWDATSLPPGAYSFRCTRYNATGVFARSDPIQVRVNRAPQPVAEVFLAGPPNAFVFDASKSTDAEGPIARYYWGFGEGVVLEGPTVVWMFDSVAPPIEITLAVEDEDGEVTATWLDLLLEELTLTESSRCVCENLIVRIAGTPVGPDGITGGMTWPGRLNVYDGAHLGPLNQDPGNFNIGTPADPEHLATGFAFEIEATVRGNPKKCFEIQLIKGTYDVRRTGLTAAECAVRGGVASGGVCTYAEHTQFTVGPNATIDLDGDGDSEIMIGSIADCMMAGGRPTTGCRFTSGTTVVDVPNVPPAPCMASGGTPFLMDCTIPFPMRATDPCAFKPDAPNLSQPHFGYRAEFSHKKYAAPTTAGASSKIVWFDAPHLRGMPGNLNGTQAHLHFKAIVRGTDGHFCSRDINVDYERRDGQDVESATVGPLRTGTGAVPGISDVP